MLAGSWRKVGDSMSSSYRMLPPQHRRPAANGPNLAVYPAGLEVQHPKNNQSSLTDKISLFSCGVK